MAGPHRGIFHTPFCLLSAPLVYRTVWATSIGSRGQRDDGVVFVLPDSIVTGLRMRFPAGRTFVFEVELDTGAPPEVRRDLSSETGFRCQGSIAAVTLSSNESPAGGNLCLGVMFCHAEFCSIQSNRFKSSCSWEGKENCCSSSKPDSGNRQRLPMSGRSDRSRSRSSRTSPAAVSRSRAGFLLRRCPPGAIFYGSSCGFYRYSPAIQSRSYKIRNISAMTDVDYPIRDRSSAHDLSGV